MKKIDFFSAEKMAIHGVNWPFSALPQSRAHFSLGIDAFNAEKIGAIQLSTEKNGATRHKLALFSATAVKRMFYHYRVQFIKLNNPSPIIHFKFSNAKPK